MTRTHKRTRRNRRRNQRIGTRSTATVETPWTWAGLGRLLSAILAVFAFAGAAAGMHFGWQALCDSSRLAIRRIDLKGAVRVRRQDVQVYAGIESGDSILRADLDAAALSLRRHPWVRSARVHRRLPDGVTVEVEEHTARVVVALGDLYLASADGKLFKRLAASDGIVLPVVTGLEKDRVAQTEVSAARIRAAIELAAAVERDGTSLGRLEELHWDESLDWSIVTRPDLTEAPLRLHLGQHGAARVGLAVRAVRKLRNLNARAAVVWVDGVKNPGRVHVRLRGRAGPESEKQKTLIAKAR